LSTGIVSANVFIVAAILNGSLGGDAFWGFIFIALAVIWLIDGLKRENLES